MNKIFVTTLYRLKADDYWGFSLSEDGQMLAEETAPNHALLSLKLGLLGSTANHNLYKTKYPKGFELVFVHQFEFNASPDFMQARTKSLHNYSQTNA